jgi:signal transduction histidine kinase
LLFWLPGPRQIRIHVKDQGIGPKASAAPVEMFLLGDKARGRRVGGTGLGLAIVKHIVHACGGQVTVENEQDRGSVFMTTLPLWFLEIVRNYSSLDRKLTQK